MSVSILSCLQSYTLVRTAVPPIPRPKENTFLRYAKEGKKEQIAEFLFHYPDLIHTKNESVSDL